MDALETHSTGFCCHSRHKVCPPPSSFLNLGSVIGLALHTKPGVSAQGLCGKEKVSLPQRWDLAWIQLSTNHKPEESINKVGRAPAAGRSKASQLFSVASQKLQSVTTVEGGERERRKRRRRRRRRRRKVR